MTTDVLVYSNSVLSALLWGVTAISCVATCVAIVYAFKVKKAFENLAAIWTFIDQDFRSSIAGYNASIEKIETMFSVIVAGKEEFAETFAAIDAKMALMTGLDCSDPDNEIFEVSKKKGNHLVLFLEQKLRQAERRAKKKNQSGSRIRTPLGQLLIDKGILDKNQLEAALDEQDAETDKLADALVKHLSEIKQQPGTDQKT